MLLTAKMGSGSCNVVAYKRIEFAHRTRLSKVRRYGLDQVYHIITQGMLYPYPWHASVVSRHRQVIYSVMVQGRRDADANEY